MNVIKKIVENPKDSILYVLTRSGIRRFIPDKAYIKFLWWLHYRKSINLDNPKRFTEKIQWLKLNDRKPEYTNIVDKYDVKDIVGKIIGPQYIIPTLGVWDKPEDIDWDKLPDKFVLKTTNGGGSQGVLICKDKSSFNKVSAIRKLNKARKQNAYLKLGEWPYKNIKKRIIAEELIQMPNVADLADYKFYCFNGKPKYIQVIQNRSTEETIDFYDIEWRHQSFYGLNPVPKPCGHEIPKPINLDKMIEIAESLSEPYAFSRIDLYECEKNIYFGEITFYPASGLGVFTPDSADFELGKLLSLTNELEVSSLATGGG